MNKFFFVVITLERSLISSQRIRQTLGNFPPVYMIFDPRQYKLSLFSKMLIMHWGCNFHQCMRPQKS